MYLFKLVKQAIDVLYAQAEQGYESPAALNAAVLGRLSSLSSSYGRLTETGRDPIDYDEVEARIAYLFCYVAAHADHVCNALHSCRHKLNEDLFHRSVLRVSSIGSGPGTDLLGILKCLHKNPKALVTEVKGRLFDRESAWGDARKALNLAYANHPDVADNPRVDLVTKTRALDVHNSRPWRTQGRPHRADLITLSYFVSEAYSQNRETAERWIRKLLCRVQAGAYLLYVDNASQPITDFFDAIWQQADFCPLYQDFGECRIANDEQKSELGRYSSCFAPRQPKLKSDLCIRLLAKRT